MELSVFIMVSNEIISFFGSCNGPINLLAQGRDVPFTSVK